MDLYPQEEWFQFLVHLSRYIDRRISRSGKHSARVAEWAHSTAAELDCSEEDVQSIFWAALLHDVGKIGIPEDILTKTSPLTDEDWSWIRLHPILGSNIVQAAKIRAQVAAMIMAHQEKVDGTGYPQGLCGEEIPLGARILAVVDAYDAMTSDRVYRDARSHGEAMDELLRLGGQHFDAEVVDAFAEVLKSEIPARKAFGRKGSGYPGNGNGRHSTPGTIPSGEQTARLLSPRSGKGPLK